MRDPLNINPPPGSKLEVFNGCLKVDGEPFVVDFPTEPMCGVEDTKLMTRFQIHSTHLWAHEEIEGYYA